MLINNNMFNKKLFIILFTSVVLIISVVVYFFQRDKIVNKTVRPVKHLVKKQAIKPKEIYPIKEFFLLTNKQVYNPNEEIKVVGVIKNPFFITKKLTVVYYLMSDDEITFSSLGQVKNIQLKPGQVKKVEFTSLVDQYLFPGNYKVKLEILAQSQKIGTKSKIIKIQKTNKYLDAKLHICKNTDCQLEKIIFLQGETAYLKINSNVSNLHIISKIKYPDKKEFQDLNFSDNLATISLTQLGSYKVIIEINKKDYNKQVIKKDFAVITKQPEIKSVSICNVDGQCLEPENSQNCPQDCL